MLLTTASLCSSLPDSLPSALPAPVPQYEPRLQAEGRGCLGTPNRRFSKSTRDWACVGHACPAAPSGVRLTGGETRLPAPPP